MFFARKIGIEKAQGFLLGRPLHFDDAMKLLDEETAQADRFTRKL